MLSFVGDGLLVLVTNSSRQVSVADSIESSLRDALEICARLMLRMEYDLGVQTRAGIAYGDRDTLQLQRYEAYPYTPQIEEGRFTIATGETADRALLLCRIANPQQVLISPEIKRSIKRTRELRDAWTICPDADNPARVTYRDDRWLEAYDLIPSQGKLQELSNKLSLSVLPVLESQVPGNLDLIIRKIEQYIRDINFRAPFRSDLQKEIKNYNARISQLTDLERKGTRLEIIDQNRLTLSRIIRAIHDCLHFNLIPESITLCNHHAREQKIRYDSDYRDLHLETRKITLDLIVTKVGYDLAYHLQVALDDVSRDESRNLVGEFQKRNIDSPKEWYDEQVRQTNYDKVWEDYHHCLQNLNSICSGNVIGVSRGEIRENGFKKFNEALNSGTMIQESIDSESTTESLDEILESLHKSLETKLTESLNYMGKLLPTVERAASKLQERWFDILRTVGHDNRGVLGS